MKQLVILSKLEEEYLVRAYESALHVRKLRQLFLWGQGEVQSLLPHGILVCLRYDENDVVQHIECLHGMGYDPEVIGRLCKQEDGLAVRMARHCRATQELPCMVELSTHGEQHPLHIFRAELATHRLGNALVHGTERLSGGATVFVMYALQVPLTSRHAFFLELLLPCLHLAFLRVVTYSDGETYAVTDVPEQALTAREIGILRWVMKGKSNYEIGVILELSPLTVKNHLQKIFRKLKVHNRTQAVLRCHSLQLLNAADA